MTCTACFLAETNSATGYLHVGCRECAARLLSRSLEHARARSVGKMTAEYMARLREVFGADWEAGHRMVKAWARREAE